MAKEEGFLNLEVEEIQLKVNEHFILHLANIVEQHFEDTMALIQRYQTAKDPQ